MPGDLVTKLDEIRPKEKTPEQIEEEVTDEGRNGKQWRKTEKGNGRSLNFVPSCTTNAVLCHTVPYCAILRTC